jgi:DNA mismatch repair protein MutS
MPPAKKTKKLTPMMEQWHDQRSRLPDDTLLLFRLGDFYEVFKQDAEEGARLLGITLTHRHGMPMAGIPYHAAETYINKLLAAGKKVAICDQVETPQTGKLVKRELTRILTPGTIVEGHQIRDDENHYLLAVHHLGKGMAAAWLDLSTGHFEATYQDEKQATQLLTVFSGLDPKEVVVPESFWDALENQESLAPFAQGFSYFCESRPVSRIDDYQFDREAGYTTLLETLGVLNLEGYGLSKAFKGLGAAGAALHYATETLCAQPRNIARVREFQPGSTLLVDPSTQRNLELFRSAAGNRKGSLLQAMNHAVTAAGARLLEQWMAAPALDPGEIHRRQACVRGFVKEPSITGELRNRLRTVRDIIRILGRLQNRIRNPRELGGIRDTLAQLPAIALTLQEFRAEPVRVLAGRIDNFDTLSDLLSSALEDDLPSNIQDGGAIRTGYDKELDHFRSLTSDSKAWLANLEATEQKRSGIKNLKIKYNGAFGYFIEVTKANLHLVPEEYTRRQTMVNAERFVTDELKAKEKEILSAEEKGLAREELLFRELIQRILKFADPLRSTAEALAEIDLFAGWANLAREWNYCEPVLDEGNEIVINQGRHPVVEQMMKEDPLGLAGTHAFIPNDTRLHTDEEQIAIITGPNMAGKSTYIRQVALITLMAHMGSWVPARQCRIGLVDRIFSRVGASDELTRGNSTFMVEMNETANILNNTTDRSLIILDEIGRGTSTYDGLSIAWSVVEHLHGKGGLGPRTLFATHYHELTQLAQALERVRNYTVAVKEWNEEIIFVRQVVPGAADRSYGIHVAQLAGLPDSVIHRAKTILAKLEADDSSHNLLRRRMKKRKEAEEAGLPPDFDDQLELF